MLSFKTTLNVLLLTLLVSSPAWTDQFFLKRLDINDCDEIGVCDWRFRYKLGHDPQDWTRLCETWNGFAWSGSDSCTETWVEADTGEAVTPHLAGKTFSSYPVTLFIEVHEMDREQLGTGWVEFVGAVDIRIDGPGSYQHSVESDEGKVTIFFDILDTTPKRRPEAVAIPQRRYLGVFERGQDDHALAAATSGDGVTWENFVDTIHSNTARGLQLVDVESWPVLGGRRYVGVFREGSELSAFYGGLRGGVDQQQWQDLTNQGYELVDQDVYTNADIAYHQSVYVRTGVETLYPTPHTMDDLFRTWPQYNADGWRLQDVEVESIHGHQYFRPTYRRGTGPTALWITDSREDFENIWRDSAAQGLRLIDVEAYPYGDRTAYISVFGGWTNGQAFVSGQTWDQFVAQRNQLSAEGYRLIDMEAYDTHDSSRMLLRAPSKVVAESLVKRVEPALASGVLGQLGESSQQAKNVTTYVANPPGHRFIRGDVNASGDVEMVDAIGILRDLFLGDSKILCDDAADANDDGAIVLSDAVHILNFLFAGRSAPVGAPAGLAQEDGTPDQLGCRQFVEVAKPEGIHRQAVLTEQDSLVEVRRELHIAAPSKPVATVATPAGPLTRAKKTNNTSPDPLAPIQETRPVSLGRVVR